METKSFFNKNQKQNKFSNGGTNKKNYNNNVLRQKNYLIIRFTRKASRLFQHLETYHDPYNIPLITTRPPSSKRVLPTKTKKKANQMKKLFKSIQRVVPSGFALAYNRFKTTQILQFPRLKGTSIRPYQDPTQKISKGPVSVPPKTRPKKSIRDSSSAASPCQDPRSQENCARRAYGRVRKPLLRRKQELQKQKQKK